MNDLEATNALRISSPISDCISLVRSLRKEYGLTISQAASALSTPASTIEQWEAHPGMGPGEAYMRVLFQEFVQENDLTEFSNLLFGVYPLKLARELLGVPIEVMAMKYNYSKWAWQKFENNGRILDREILSEIENEVSDHFFNACRRS